MFEETTRLQLEGTEPGTPAGERRISLARNMLASGDRDLFLETDDLPYLPNAIAVLDREGETLGYLPIQAAKEIRDLVAAIEEDPDEEARATLVAVNDEGILIEIDPDDFPEYDQTVQPEPAAKKEDKKKSAGPYALIAIIAFYLAFRLFTRSGG